MVIYRHKWLNNGTKNWKWVLSVVIEHNSYFLLHSYSQVSLGVLAPIWHLKRCVFFCRILSSFQPESVPGMILLHPMVSLNQTLPVLAPLIYRLAAPSSALRVIFVIVAVRPPASSEASNQSGGVCAAFCLALSLLWSLQWMSLEHLLASCSWSVPTMGPKYMNGRILRILTSPILALRYFF